MTKAPATADFTWDLEALARRASARSLAASASRVESTPYAVGILEAFPGPAFILNAERQLVGANEQAYRAFGSGARDDMFGSRPGEIVGCQVAHREPGGCGTGEACRQCGILGSILTSAETRRHSRGEGMLSTVDGGTINVEVAVNCIELESEPLLFLGFRDISAEKHREFLQGAFLHDLMNTAGGLQGLLEISRDDRTDRAELIPIIEGLVKTIVDEVEGQKHILRAEQGNLQLELSPLDLDQMLAQVTTLYRAHPVARGRTLALVASTGATVVTDGTLLRRVVGNMIKNALEATPEGGQVAVSAATEDEQMVISVHNPSFIPESVQAHIFKRGFSTKGQGRGTGTHAMRIITERYLGGHIEFVSRESTGTRFMLRLRERPRGLPSAPAESSRSEASELRLDGVRVVVADDDAVNRRIAAHRLTKLGADVETVASGGDAITAVRDRGADLVLLDLEMPGLSGLQTAVQLRPPDALRPRIIIVSGHEASSDAAGPYDLWIEKPLREADLQRVARDLLDSA